MRLRARLQKLERGVAFDRDCCGPGCPSEAVVVYRQDGDDGAPVPDEGQTPPSACPRGGRPARVLELLVVYDPNFYGNAARLRGAET